MANREKATGRAKTATQASGRKAAAAAPVNRRKRPARQAGRPAKEQSPLAGAGVHGYCHEMRTSGIWSYLYKLACPSRHQQNLVFVADDSSAASSDSDSEKENENANIGAAQPRRKQKTASLAELE